MDDDIYGNFFGEKPHRDVALAESRWGLNSYGLGETMKVSIFTDGAARGNPDGPGGYGAVLRYVDSKGGVHEKELSAGYKKTTNNRMELMAAIRGLQQLNRGCEVDLTDAFNQGWIYNWQKKGWVKSDKKPVKNIDLWKALLVAMEPHQVRFIWVKGHDGHPENERCDQLATGAADGNDLLDDVELV